jgi:hypothetical protein
MYSLAVQTRDKLNRRFFEIYMLSENIIQIPANYL